MFGKKLILIAATAALALGSISAKDASTVHVRVHSNDKSVCTGAGQSPMSVEGVEGVYCVTGQACVANIANGACPAAQTGLPNGSHCGKVKTGVYGCKPGPAPTSGAPKCDGPGQSPMSVEGAGTYCVTGQACVANISNGACPGPQAGIPNGSFCAQVRPGVWGCRAKTSRHHKHHKSHSKSVCTGAGQSPMSVEGVEGVYCVTGQACVANIANGACPAAQTGLPNGSHCGKVKTGVYGCKPGPAPTSGAPKCDGPGQSPMSVEGAGTYCVTGQACVANISNGACPGPQAGLQYGSYCGKVKTGVYGCIPKKSATEGGNSTVVIVIDVEEDDSSDDIVPAQISVEDDDSEDDSADDDSADDDSEDDDSAEEAAEIDESSDDSEDDRRQ